MPALYARPQRGELGRQRVDRRQQLREERTGPGVGECELELVVREQSGKPRPQERQLVLEQAAARERSGREVFVDVSENRPEGRGAGQKKLRRRKRPEGRRGRVGTRSRRTRRTRTRRT